LSNVTLREQHQGKVTGLMYDEIVHGQIKEAGDLTETTCK
jgi:hypothetical protein